MGYLIMEGSKKEEGGKSNLELFQENLQNCLVLWLAMINLKLKAYAVLVVWSEGLLTHQLLLSSAQAQAQLEAELA